VKCRSKEGERKCYWRFVKVRSRHAASSYGTHKDFVTYAVAYKKLCKLSLCTCMSYVPWIFIVYCWDQSLLLCMIYVGLS